MPKTKLQDAVFTALMATLMVYGMVVYNISLDLGGVSARSFRLALNELPLMAAIAFVLEFFVVGKLAPDLRSQPAHGSALAAALLRPLRPAGFSGFDAGVFPCRRQGRGL